MVRTRVHTTILLLGVTFLAAAGMAKLVQLQAADAPTSGAVGLRIDDPHGKTLLNASFTFDASNGTVLDVLLQAARVHDFTVGLREYAGQGTMVVQIFGIRMDASCGWVYYVNDAFADVGAADYVLRDGDEVRWTWSC